MWVRGGGGRGVPSGVLGDKGVHGQTSHPAAHALSLPTPLTQAPLSLFHLIYNL
jgi:hypothetical protein